MKSIRSIFALASLLTLGACGGMTTSDSKISPDEAVSSALAVTEFTHDAEIQMISWKGAPGAKVAYHLYVCPAQSAGLGRCEALYVVDALDGQVPAKVYDGQSPKLLRDNVKLRHETQSDGKRGFAFFRLDEKSFRLKAGVKIRLQVEDLEGIHPDVFEARPPKKN